MIYAQFYHRGMITGKLIEAVGDRGVIILDGRNSRSTHRVIAAEECIKRKYAGYSLHQGETFTRSHLIEPFVPSQIWKIKDTVTLENLIGLMQSGDKAVAAAGIQLELWAVQGLCQKCSTKLTTSYSRDDYG
jgi:hypothetical protein